MTLIVIKNKKTLTMPYLLRAALKFIYEEENMSADEIKEMMLSINHWKSAIDLEDEKLKKNQNHEILKFGFIITTEHKYSEEKENLIAIAKFLKMNEDGELDERKASFKQHNIDYLKFHRLPEAYNPEDFENAELALEETKRAYPDDYK